METKLILKVKEPRECGNCGEPASYKNTYLNDGQTGARHNPASSAYGRDDCTWCSDYDQFLCGDCHANCHEADVPEGFHWCSTFEKARLPHMFWQWCEVEIDATEAASAIDGPLSLIRKAQERLTDYLRPDGPDDDRETLNDLLYMFDGPEQREIEKQARDFRRKLATKAEHQP